jgi:cytoplasmic iron level regulating protein YaaA (DUF328/UPF0246 family)
MLMVISPAKSLDFTAPDQILPLTTPELKPQIAELGQGDPQADGRRPAPADAHLREAGRAEPRALPALRRRGRRGLQAVIAFNGDVYAGLNARELDRPALDWAQDHLRILSGLYGVLRPLDALQAYRLEMGTRLKTKKGSNLYDYWGETISKTLNAAAEGHADPTLVNLASQEYFGAVDAKALKLPTVTCPLQGREGQYAQGIGLLRQEGPRPHGPFRRRQPHRQGRGPQGLQSRRLRLPRRSFDAGPTGFSLALQP